MNAKLVQTSRNTRVVSFGCPCIDVFDGFTHGITAATLYASMENNGHPVSGNRFFGLCLLGTPSFMDLFLSDVFSAVMSHSFKSQLHQLMANALCTLACSGCYFLESVQVLLFVFAFSRDLHSNCAMHQVQLGALCLEASGNVVITW